MVLSEYSSRPPDVRDTIGSERLIIEEDLSGRGVEETGEELDCRRFSTPINSDDDYELARLDGERDIGDDVSVCTWVAECNVSRGYSRESLGVEGVLMLT